MSWVQSVREPLAGISRFVDSGSPPEALIMCFTETICLPSKSRQKPSFHMLDLAPLSHFVPCRARPVDAVAGSMCTCIRLKTPDDLRVKFYLLIIFAFVLRVNWYIANVQYSFVHLPPVVKASASEGTTATTCS